MLVNGFHMNKTSKQVNKYYLLKSSLKNIRILTSLRGTFILLLNPGNLCVTIVRFFPPLCKIRLFTLLAV